MSVTAPPTSQTELPQAPSWDPNQGDLTSQHGLMPGQMRNLPPATPQQLHAAGWMDCPRCHKFWISPENKAQIDARGGYFTCPHCRLTTDLLHDMPWHGATEEDYYPKGNTGGGTAVGIPMDDVGQIAENLVQQMGEIPGYGPITWWHPGGATGASALDGATREWGIEVKGMVYDAASHYWHPGDVNEANKKNQAAAEMGLSGVLGVFVLENFRTDTADIYVKEMPLDPRLDSSGKMIRGGAIKWHKRTGIKVASDVPFANPLKDPHNPTPGPYSMADYYERPMPLNYQPSEPAPF